MSRTNVIQLRKQRYTEIEDYLPLEDLPDDRDILDRVDAVIDLLKTPDPAVLEALQRLEASVTLKEVSEEAPLRLEDAVCLPELGGSYTADPALRTPSETVSIKTLRKAIADGKLAVVRFNSKNLYVTRRAIGDWLEACHARKTPSPSSSNLLDMTRKVSSRIKPSGISDGMASGSKQAAAKQNLRKLRNI